MPDRLPDVTLEDLDRIMRRDFPPEQHGQVVNLLIRYGRGDRGQNRVCADVLKLADGDLSLVEYYVECALGDSRDVMFWAEYPTASEEENWRQYQEWFSR